MTPRTKTRAAIAMLLAMMVNAVLFGAGIVIVLVSSGANLATWLPVVVALSLLLAFPIGWEIAPRLRLSSRPRPHAAPVVLRTQQRTALHG